MSVALACSLPFASTNLTVYTNAWKGVLVGACSMFLIRFLTAYITTACIRSLALLHPPPLSPTAWLNALLFKCIYFTFLHTTMCIITKYLFNWKDLQSVCVICLHAITLHSLFTLLLFYETALYALFSFRSSWIFICNLLLIPTHIDHATSLMTFLSLSLSLRMAVIKSFGTELNR